MTTRPFTVGIIQDAASSDAAANVDGAVARVREAAARGAQIICLKELFNAPYFCKSQKCERFDLAEPIPGPTTDAMQELAKELEVVLIVPIFERQARGVYRNSAAVIDADGSLLGVYRKMHIPRRSALQREVLLHAGRRGARRSHRRIGEVAKQASGFRVWNTRYANIGVLICWDQWYPEAARITACSAPTSCSIRRPSAGTRRRRRSSARRRWTRGARSSARTRSPTASSSRRRTASATRTSRAPTASSSSATRSSPIRSAASSPRRAREHGDARRQVRPELIEDTRRNWPFLRDRRIDAYAPILSGTRRESVGRDGELGRDAESASPTRDRSRIRHRCACPPSGSRTTPPGSPGRTTSRTGRASSRRSRGCTPRSCARSRSTSASRSSATTRPCARTRAAHARRARRHARTYRLHLVPNDRVWLRDSAPTVVHDERGEVVLVNWALQRLGEVRQLRARRRGRRARSSASPALPRIEPMRPDNGERLVLEGGGIETNGAGHDARDRGVAALRRAGAQSRARPRRLRAGLPRVPRHPRDDLARRGLRRRRHARPRRRHRALRRARRRSCSRTRRIRPTTRTTAARSTTCAGSSSPVRRRGALQVVTLPVPARRRHERRAAARELRELLHRQRRRARADVQRPERPRRAERARRAVSRTRTSSASTPSIWSGGSAPCTA